MEYIYIYIYFTLKENDQYLFSFEVQRNFISIVSDLLDSLFFLVKREQRKKIARTYG